MSRHLLVLSQPGYSLSVPLPDAFRKYAPTLTADEAEPTNETLEHLADRGYDAVLCWAEHAEELDLVVRIRQTNPKLPIMLLSSGDEGFRSLALQKGASAVLPPSKNLPNLVSLIEQAVMMRASARETSQRAAEGKLLSKELRELTRQTLLLSAESRRRLDKPPRAALLPLLVCDDPEQAFQLVRALEKAQVFAPLPILKSGDEATAYLDGRPPYQNRARHPLPSLVLLDLHVDSLSGLSVLTWIRQHDRFQHLPVIMLSASVNAEDIKQAYGVQANSYLIKPAGFEELVEMVKAINLNWSSLNISPDH